jgi:hypothetical protein
MPKRLTKSYKINISQDLRDVSIFLNNTTSTRHRKQFSTSQKFLLVNEAPENKNQQTLYSPSELKERVVYRDELCEAGVSR